MSSKFFRGSDESSSEEDEVVDEEEEEEEEEKEKKPAQKKPAKSGKKSESEEEESEEEDEEEEDEDEDEEEEDQEKDKDQDEDVRRGDDSDDEEDLNLHTANPKSAMFTREFWLKKADQKESKKKKKKDSESEESDEDDDEEGDEESEEDDESHSEDEDAKRRRDREKRRKAEIEAERLAREKSALQERKKEEITADWIVKKLKDLMALRGRRGTDRLSIIDSLKDLRVTAAALQAKLNASASTAAPITTTTTPAATGTGAPAEDGVLSASAVLKIDTTLVSCLFDVTMNRGDSFMSPPLWREAYSLVSDIIDRVVISIKSNETLRLAEDQIVEEQFESEVAAESITNQHNEEKESEDKKKVQASNPPTVSKDGFTYVLGSVLAWVKLLSTEYRRSLLQIDHHTQEYVDRLRDEWDLVKLLQKANNYYLILNKPAMQAKCALMHMDLIYYHHREYLDHLVQEALKQNSTNPATAVTNTTDSTEMKSLPSISQEEVPTLARLVIASGDDKSRVRALLYQVSHWAIHNRWNEARDLLLMSHVQDNINEADIRTRILYNRTMALLGLAAFRNGDFRSALHCVADLFGANHVRELLAQGIRWGSDQPAEVTAAEKRRLLPFHTHISLDALEAVHLISAMLVEVPNLAIHGPNGKRKMASRTFRRMFEHHLKQAFNGPPENTRDLIMAATKALRQGDWNKTCDFLQRLRFWQQLPVVVKDKIWNQLQNAVREEALRTWLAVNAPNFITIQVNVLSKQFNLSEQIVRRAVSKMIINEHLHGAWDEPTNSIVIHAQQNSSLQKQALAYADKISQLVEQNEKMVDHRYKPGNERDERDLANAGRNVGLGANDDRSNRNNSNRGDNGGFSQQRNSFQRGSDRRERRGGDRRSNRQTY